MEKTKSALPSYLGLCNETLSAYTKAVLSTNTLLLGYTAVAVRTILQPVPTPVAKPAGGSDAALTASTLVAAAEAITVPEIPEPVHSAAALPAATFEDVADCIELPQSDAAWTDIAPVRAESAVEPPADAPQSRARPARKKTSGPGRRRKK